MTWISTCRSQAVTCSATNVGSNRNRTVHTLFSLRKRARYSSRALGAKRRQTQHSVTTWLNRMRSYLKFTPLKTCLLQKVRVLGGRGRGRARLWQKVSFWSEASDGLCTLVHTLETRRGSIHSGLCPIEKHHKRNEQGSVRKGGP